MRHGGQFFSVVGDLKAKTGVVPFKPAVGE